MKILKLNLENYKSFRTSGWLDFSPNFTVVIGKNNAGKSALLEAFRLSANRSHPHRMLSTSTELLDQQSFVDFELSISGEELKNTVLAVGGSKNIPISPTLQDNASREAEALALFQTQSVTL